jgi:hypothetical protein
MIQWGFDTRKLYAADGVCGFSLVLESVSSALKRLVHNVVAGEAEARNQDCWDAPNLVGNLRVVACRAPPSTSVVLYDLPLLPSVKISQICKRHIAWRNERTKQLTLSISDLVGGFFRRR